MSGLVRAYLALSILLAGLVVLQYATGWEPERDRREEVPASLRATPGGYRSFHFWHMGTSGGK
jgi:hypothetical protein